MRARFIPRLDRALSVRFVHPVSRLLNLRTEPQVPILMYHGICDAKGAKHPYFETATALQVFADQMQFLHDNGYATIDLTEALASLEGRGRDQKRVVITFDDGYRDFYTRAFPILMRYGFSATVFVVTDFARRRRSNGNRAEYMTWQEICELRSCGIRIGSHTVTHPELQRLSAEQITLELGKSKQVIEEQLGGPVQSFSYPYAFPEQDRNFVGLLKEILQGCGYENGVSTIIGTATRQHDRFFLPRLPVNSYDDLKFFRTKLEGGYDWLHRPQYCFKVFQRTIW